MQYTDLIEALKPSEYRLFVKGWNKERYADIFKSDKYKHDKNGYRVYLPLGEDKNITHHDSLIQRRVEKELNANNYSVIDYKKGLAKNEKNGQTIKIGKVLNKLGDEKLLNRFTSDETREAINDDYIVIISRHPYDIAGMSTNRGWTSCMNLHGGEFNEYVPLEIDAGSVIAYVTKASDPDLKNPTGRIAIKPFVNVLDPDNKDFVYFGVENKIYGTNVPGFKQAVLGWVNWVNNSNKLDDVAYISFNNRSYADGMSTTGKVIGNPDLEKRLKSIRENPWETIEELKNPNDAEIMAILEGDMSLFNDIIKRFGMPSERVQKFAVEQYADNITYITDPSDAVKLAAIRSKANIIKDISNPTEQMIMAAVSRRPTLLSLFPDASEKVMMRAVNANPIIFSHISNPPENVIRFAVSKKPNLIAHVKNPSKEVQMAAVKKDPYAIDSIRRPDQKVIDYVRSRGIRVED